VIRPVSSERSSPGLGGVPARSLVSARAVVYIAGIMAIHATGAGS
jgi:hypothetical protein